MVADQSERAQTLLRASGELARLPFHVEFANFVGGPEIQEAFRADAADVAAVGDAPPILALVARQDIPIILARVNDPGSTQLAVAPGTRAYRLADLRGKKIAYAEGTGQQVIVLRALAQAGLTTADVQLVRLQLVEFNDAVRTGTVDVAPLNEPRLTRFLTTAKDRGGGVIDPRETVTTSTGLDYLYARGGALDDPGKAAALRAYAEAYIRAWAWADRHPDQWVQRYYVESQHVGADAGRRIVASLGPSTFPRLDRAAVGRQQGTIDVIDRAGELPRPARAADGFDLRFDEVVARVVPQVAASYGAEVPQR